MKYSQKGSALIVLFIIIVVAAIGGGAYIYKDKKTEAPQGGPSATIDSVSPSTISGTSANTKSLSVNIIATTPAKPTGYTTIFGRTISVINGKWSLSIPQDTFNGFSGPYKVEVELENSSGVVNVLATKIFTATNIPSTAGWKTYMNNQYGFQVSYPSDWEVVAISEGNTARVTAGFYFGPKGGNGYINGSIDDSKWAIQVFPKDAVIKTPGTKFTSGNKTYVIFNEGLKPELFSTFLSSFTFISI
ncbi:hypothetical protein KW782_04090 [Candidatus Parcubacteria bacterium]|nr:hypothetical protein [Candidatus Parcubacteria bacterium]